MPWWQGTGERFNGPAAPLRSGGLCGEDCLCGEGCLCREDCLPSTAAAGGTLSHRSNEQLSFLPARLGEQFLFSECVILCGRDQLHFRTIQLYSQQKHTKECVCLGLTLGGSDNNLYYLFRVLTLSNIVLSSFWLSTWWAVSRWAGSIRS